MKVQELVELMSDNKTKLLKEEQRQALLKRNLDVKEYIGIKDKKSLVESIVNECILYEDGVFKFDDIDKYVCFTMRIIEAYTNLELSEDFEEDYDMLCRSNMLDSVINTFKKEYDDVNILLQMKCDYVLSGNTLESQVGKFLDGVLEKADVLVRALSNKIDGFNLSDLKFDGTDLSKLMQLINTEK